MKTTEFINAATALLACEKGFKFSSKYAYSNAFENNTTRECHKAKFTNNFSQLKITGAKGMCSAVSKKFLREWLQQVHGIQIILSIDDHDENERYYFYGPMRGNKTISRESYPADEAYDLALQDALKLLPSVELDRSAYSDGPINNVLY